MDRFKELVCFVNVAQRGSLTAAAAQEGVTAAVVSRRLDALEARLGVKLLLRTTRRVTLTFEGMAFLEDAQRVLGDLANAEASVSLGGVKASGHIRMTAPAGFGRRHVAPLIREYLNDHEDVSVSLDLSDRVVDLVNEGFDFGVRIGDLPDSSLVSIRLGAVRRVVVASPQYLERCGVPQTPDDLAEHNCLVLSQQRGWALKTGSSDTATTVKVRGAFSCNDGAVLREWALAGAGIAWRSLWEVGDDVRSGALVEVLADYATAPMGIYALFPQRRHLSLRVRLLVDYLKSSYAASASRFV
ncbi:LysR family transcriptional regulator [Niveibacterium sp. 24ML]|uniref:LysR family transcriptional regulator n=1 Tax=Niveibacterium sp. 24ML TaxID=2985512 RepID=UPI0022709CE8|nr:LysR family transcriptional regulator [Niveibacterium sp. 24ML]MCX9157133.1 LysR family transcriptional regulator [Niveibacterium sp. 24ML]